MSDDGITNNSWKGYGIKHLWPHLKRYPSTGLEGLNKTTENRIQPQPLVLESTCLEHI
jgi:hypothetical protein